MTTIRKIPIFDGFSDQVIEAILAYVSSD